MSSKKKVYVVPHSHWDREWYFTMEDSNVLLSQNMPYLMNVLENNEKFNSYTFDGQLSVVEEFLKIYPESRERLKKLIKEKRIFVGPWYTQTDTLLVNKESIIRNLLYGTRLGNSFGHFMHIGYLPDIFGQNQYLPSIFNGFGIKDSVLQRGVHTKELKNNLNFNWISPDGCKVRANNIFLGYGPGKFLSADDNYIGKKLMPMLEKLESLNKDTNNILFPAGGDQVLVRNHFPKTVEELNKQQDKYEFILSDYENFMKDTWVNAFDNNIQGELIACEKSRIHNTIKSQRYDIKKSNYDVENKILYILEPLAVIGKAVGIEYPSSWIDSMWKLLFDAHAHDSIGGCNSDDTNREILNRLVKVDRICSDLINIIKKQITHAVSKSIEKENIVLLFNTKIKNTRENIEAVVFTNKKEFELKDLKHKEVEFDVIKQDFINGGKQVIVTADGEVEVELPGYYRTEVIINNIEIPSMGYKTLLITDGKLSEEKILKIQKENFIENEFYKFVVEKNSCILVSKITGEVIENALYFEDTIDDGDSYDYSPSDNNNGLIINNTKIDFIKKSQNVQQISLIHRGKQNEDVDIKTTMELRKNESFLRVKHEIDNKAMNHRMRVVLNTNINSETSIADQGFSCIERNNSNSSLKDWKERGFAEAPVPIYSMENMVALKGKEKLYGVIAKGIKEYEILEDSKIALTLFRSVGLLGKDNISWRPGRASGINNKVVYTPDAQLQKKMKFEYCINLIEEKDVEIALFNNMDTYINRYITYQKQKLNLFEERLERFEIPFTLDKAMNEFSLLNIDNMKILQSVCKESYDKEGVIIRLFNPGERNENVKLNSNIIKSLAVSDLYEEKEESYKDNIIIKAKSYVTIKLKI